MASYLLLNLYIGIFTNSFSTFNCILNKYGKERKASSKKLGGARFEKEKFYDHLRAFNG